MAFRQHRRAEVADPLAGVELADQRCRPGGEAGTGEAPAQPLERAMHAHPGVAGAAADLLGDVLVVQATAVVQQQRQAVGFRQLGELAAQRFVQARTLLGVGFLAFIHTRSRMFEGEMTFMTALPATPAHQL